MAKKKVSDFTLQIRKLMDANKLVMGTEKTMKMLCAGKIVEVLLASNCTAKCEETFKKYGALAGAEINKMNVPADEIGVICKKQFAISVLGILKGK